MWDPTSIGEENKTFFIRTWKPLPSKCVLKTLRGSPEGKAQREQYLLAVGLGCYKWYQSQTSGDVPVKTLGPQGVWIVRPTLVGEENETFFIRVWKPLPSKRVLKTLRGSPEGKAQRGQYLLAMGLACYKWYQSQTSCNVPVRTLGP